MSNTTRSAFRRELPVLGTPMSPTATRVMVLGSGELGKEVIIALQRLGVEVIAVDRYANAPGHAVAHRAYVTDMSNAQALRELIEKEAPDCIVPEIEAIATEVLIELEAEGTIVVPTARAAWMTMNREHIRKLAAETLAFPTSAYRFATSREELHQAIASLHYPCFIKPVMSSSGKGQSRVTRQDEIDAAWDYAGSAGRVNVGRVIVEQGIDFDFEITLLTVRFLDAQGELQTAFCEPIGHRQVDGDYVESWQPQAMSGAALQSAQRMAQAVTTELGGLGIFGVEFFVKADEVWFSEVSPRPHDTGMVTLKSQVQNEFEIHARAILGLPVNVRLNSPAASAVIYGGMDAVGIRYAGLREALANPEADVRLFGKPVAFPRRRMGVALVAAPTVESARLQATAAAACVRPVV